MYKAATAIQLYCWVHLKALLFKPLLSTYRETKQQQGTSLLAKLPKDLPEALLVQAWQQLDQRHHFTIIPLVCRSWRQLALQTLTSAITLVITEEVPIQQLSHWMLSHGINLRSLNLSLQLGDLSYIDELQELASLIEECSNLRSLSLLGWTEENPLPDLSQLPQLTQLRLEYRPKEAIRVLPQQLRSLELRTSSSPWSGEDVSRLVTRVPQLRSLDVTETAFSEEMLPTLRSLSALQELRVSLGSGSSETLAALKGLPCTGLMIRLSRTDGVEQFASTLQQQVQHNSSSRSSSTSVLSGLRSLRVRLQPDERLLAFRRLAARYDAVLRPSGLVAAAYSDPWAHLLLPPLAAAMAGGTGLLSSLRSLVLTGYESVVKDLSLLTGLRQLTSMGFIADLPATADVGLLTALSGLRELRVKGLSEGQVEVLRGLVVSSLSCLTKLELDTEPFVR